MDDDYEDLGGRRVKRGVDGKFEHVELDPATAAAMGKSTLRKAARLDDDVDDLLDELGLAGPSASKLAEVFAKGGSGAVQAARQLFRMSHPYNENPQFTPGGVCPTCGHDYSLRSMLTVDAEVLRTLLEELRGRNAEKGKTAREDERT